SRGRISRRISSRASMRCRTASTSTCGRSPPHSDTPAAPREDRDMSLLPFPDAVHVRAPGQINVYLGVGARHDDGYHALATVFQAVSLYEDVIARPADDFSIVVKGVADPASVPLDDRNLAMRAAKLLASVTGYEGGAALELRKSVP